jgi:hypothetical protein
VRVSDHLRSLAAGVEGGIRRKELSERA